MPTTPTLDQLAAEIVDIIPRLEETDQRIGVALIRHLAQGAPVAIADLAADLAMAEKEVAERIDRMPGVYRDDDGRVVGYFGITVVEMGKHRLHVDGHTVSAWCAWDTLFLPDVLGRTVDVTSRSPNHDEPISLTVTPEGPRDVTPPEAVVTFVPPRADFVNNTIASFCHYVHFFPSPESAAEWTAEHPDTFAVPLADAYELAEVLTQTVFGTVVPTREERCAGEHGRAADTADCQGTAVPLEHLFDAELAYQPGMAPIAEDGDGELAGSGDGRVDGPSLRGLLRWTLFEGPGDLVCTMSPTLVIETEDGASIGFEGKGYGRRANPTDQLWRVAATLLFRSSDERYKWLDGALGVWEGVFDAGQGRARYQAFLLSGER